MRGNISTKIKTNSYSTVLALTILVLFSTLVSIAGASPFSYNVDYEDSHIVYVSDKDTNTTNVSEGKFFPQGHFLVDDALDIDGSASTDKQSYWIDTNYDMYTPVDVGAGQTFSFNMTKAAGYTPNGSQVFPFFDDFNNTDPVQYDGVVTQLTNIPYAVTDAPVIAYNGNIIMFGGYNSISDVNVTNTQIYYPGNNTWAQLAPMPHGVWGEEALLYQDRVYCFSGSDQGLTAPLLPYVQVYNITTNTWSYANNMPNVIGYQGLMGVNGANADAYLYYKSFFFKYNFTTDIYTQLANTPKPVSWGQLCYVPSMNRIYEFGGTQDMGATGTNTMYYYDITNNTWSGVLATAPYSVYGHTREQLLYGDKMIVGYGQGPGSTFHSEMYYYNLTTGQWSTRFALGLHPRDGVGAVIIGDYLYVIDGRDSGASNHPGLQWAEKIDLSQLTANQHVIPDKTLWNYLQNSGQLDVSNSVLNITGNPTSGSNWFEWLQAEQGFIDNYTISFRAKIGITSWPQINEIGFKKNKNPATANGMDSCSGVHYADAGNETSYDQYNAGSSYFGDWHIYNISRTGLSGTKFYMDGTNFYNSPLDAVGVTRYPNLFVRGTGKMSVDYMYVRQYTAIPPVVTLTQSGSVYHVSVYNLGAEPLTNYQISIPATSTGITSQTESWNVRYIPGLPVSNFSTNVTIGYAPLSVQFNDSSENATGWNWDFGDGNTSTEQNPMHIYSKAGNYTVTLTANNSAGNNTIIKYNYITVVKSDDVIIEGSAPLSMQFTDLSEGATIWEWDFGDGNTSTEQNPTHTYSIPGQYTVILTASNIAGSSEGTKYSYILVTNPLESPSTGSPVANFSASTTSGKAPLNISFTDKSTGSPNSWKWDFGDGNISTEQNSTHTYSKPGQYTVILTVNNIAGSSGGTKYINISVSNSLKAPVADFSASIISEKASLNLTEQANGHLKLEKR